LHAIVFDWAASTLPWLDPHQWHRIAHCTAKPWIIGLFIGYATTQDIRKGNLAPHQKIRLDRFFEQIGRDKSEQLVIRYLMKPTGRRSTPASTIPLSCSFASAGDSGAIAVCPSAWAYAAGNACLEQAR